MCLYLSCTFVYCLSLTFFLPDALTDLSQSWQHSFQIYSKCVWKQSVHSTCVLSIWALCPTMLSSAPPGWATPVVCLMSWVLSLSWDVLSWPLLSQASLFPGLLLHFSRAHPSSFLTKGTWEVHVLRLHMSKNVFVPPSIIFAMSTEFQVENHFSSDFWTLHSAIF